MGSKKKDKDRKRQRAKEKRDELDKLEKSNLDKVVSEQAREIDQSDFPASVAVLSSDLHDGEQYLVSYMHYSDNECEIDQMTSDKSRSCGHALYFLRKIGLYAQNLKKMTSKEGFQIWPVKDAGEYKNLYKGLERLGIDTKQLTIYESYIRTKNDGRLFFWISNTYNTIFVIAIRQNHYKT